MPTELTVRYSELATLANCQLQYKLAFADGLSVPAGKSLVRGSAFHALMQGHYESFRDDDAQGVPRDLNRSRRRAAQRLSEYRRGEGVKHVDDELIELLRWMFDGYIERWGTDEELDQFLVIDEKRLVPLVSHRGVRVTLQCTADLVAHHRTYKRWLILDHKEQPVSERVATPDGWRSIGSLEVGDLVLGRNGSTSRVTNLFPKGTRPVYRVTMADGSSARAGDGHLWSVGYAGHKHSSVITTEDLKRRVDSGSKKVHLPGLTGPLQFEHQDLPIDPYTLGYLLGNGSMHGSLRVTAHEDDVEEVLTNLDLGYEGSLGARHRQTRADGSISRGVSVGLSSPSIRTALKVLGLWGSSYREKHVPRIYMESDVKQRYEMLRGLMDSDGSSSARNSRFITTSPQLAQDIQDLVLSLAGRARFSKFAPLGVCKGRPGTHDAYCVYVTTHENPHKLVRKAALRDTQSRLPWTARRVVSVERVLDEECVCIEVDTPDHLYVTAGSIVTHNTQSGRDASKDATKKENQLDPQRALYTASFKLQGLKKDRLAIFGALHNVVRADQLKRPMTSEERFGRNTVYYSDTELNNVWEEAKNLARDAVEIRLGVGRAKRMYSNPNPSECSWRCAFKEVHLISRATNRDAAQVSLDYGFERAQGWESLRARVDGAT